MFYSLLNMLVCPVTVVSAQCPECLYGVCVVICAGLLKCFIACVILLGPVKVVSKPCKCLYTQWLESGLYVLYVQV